MLSQNRNGLSHNFTYCQKYSNASCVYIVCNIYLNISNCLISEEIATTTKNNCHKTIYPRCYRYLV